MTDQPTVGFVGVATPLSTLVREMIVSTETVFGAGEDYTEMAQWCERLAGEAFPS